MTQHTFSIQHALTFGWEKTKEHSWFLFQVALVSLFLLSIPTFPPLHLLVGLIVMIGLVGLSLRIVDGQPTAWKDLLLPFTNKTIFIKSLLGTLLYMVIIGLLVTLIGVIDAAVIFKLFSSSEDHIWLAVGVGILSLWPLLYISLRLKFYIYAIIDSSADVRTSFTSSWNSTRGMFLKLLAFNLILAAINLLGLLLLGVGLVITVPLSLIAYAYVYKMLKDHHMHKSKSTSGPHIA